MEINEEDLRKKYNGLSNNELFEIIDNKFGYTDLAIKVAINELSKRDLSENDVQSYKTKLIEDFEESILKAVHYDLKLYQKILFYIFWLPFLNFPFKINFRQNKEHLKLKQANYYSLFGFVFFMIITLIGTSFHFSELSFLFLWLVSIIPVYVLDDKLRRKRLIRNQNERFEEYEASEEDGRG